MISTKRAEISKETKSEKNFTVGVFARFGRSFSYSHHDDPKEMEILRNLFIEYKLFDSLFVKILSQK